jgi:hypothetical protein
VTRFTYSDVVRVTLDAPESLRRGEIASVIAVFETRPEGSHFAPFPQGVVYSIEYADGEAVEIHDAHLEPAE